MMKPRGRFPAAIAALFVAPSALLAQDAAPEAPPPAIEQPLHADESAPPPPPPPGSDSENFHLTFTPLIWFTSYNGTTGVKGLKFDIDQTFIDIVENSETVFGLMGAIDGEYKRFVFQLNGVYTTATFDEHRARTRSGPLGGGTSLSVDASVEVHTTWLEAFGGYRFVDEPLSKSKSTRSRFILDGFVGGRFTIMDVDADIRLDASVTLPGGEELEAGRRNDIGDEKNWFEPFIGARTAFEFDEHWNLMLRGDIGGFGVDNSDFSWSALAALGYKWRMDGWNLNVFGGYRALSQDYSDDGFTWDVITHGPVIGAQFILTF